MKQSAAILVRRLWRYCGILRDDGLSYPDYVEQLTYLLFLKMAAERNSVPIPSRYAWSSFVGKGAKELHQHYGRALQSLGKQDGMLGLIFRNAKNKIKDPAKLRLLVEDLIGQTEWSELSTDVKGDAYEGLLEKNAQDTKSGAGQYFTPRVLVDAIVECVRPQLGEVICDPACGTGGFLLAAHEYVGSSKQKLSKAESNHLNNRAIRGVELVEEVARLATMNLLLHGIGENSSARELPITCADSLKAGPRPKVDVVLTNPPFGTRGSVTYTQNRGNGKVADLEIVRPDFWVKTANKQLNFLQHVVSILKPGGRAAVVLPDNVLFESGAAAAIRRRLLETCNVHTLLRLPTGLFYAQGVKANVLFFDKPASRSKASNRVLSVYDLRGVRLSLKANPLQRKHLDEFVACYQSRGKRKAKHAEMEHESWRHFQVKELLAQEECRLDLSWAGPTSARTSEIRIELSDIASLIASDLRDALNQIEKISLPPGK